MHLYFSVYILFILLPVCILGALGSFGPRKFILSKDCISMPTAIVGLEEPNTKTLRIDDLDGGAVIYSHDFESGVFANASTTLSGQNYYAQYPLDFACEVVVHAPIENGRIMLSIVSFFIPSSDQTCKDDFLYVFDSNTARSKAMPEAGGEQGLCLSHYPKVPVFSSKSYICVAFHTSNSPRSKLPANPAVIPGFKITVTAFQESQTLACPEGRFYCGVMANAVSGIVPSVLDFNGGRTAVRLPSMGICVSESVRCDGVVNCPDGRDEFPSLCGRFQDDVSAVSDNEFFGQFLSLGMTTTVSIVVAVALFFVLCLGGIVCLCCCRKRYNSDNVNSINAVGITVSNGTNRPTSGEVIVHHTEPSALLNGIQKSHEAFHAHVLPQQQQIMMAPVKSVGNLFQPHHQHQQLAPNSPMLRRYQEYPSSQPQPPPPPPPPPTAWNMQPVPHCCPPPHHPQWFSQQPPTPNNQPMAIPSHNQPHLPSGRISDTKANLTSNDSRFFIGSPPATSVPACPPQQQPPPASPQQQPPVHLTCFEYQNPTDNSLLVADGGIVYLGEIGGGGSGSGGSRLAGGSRRPRRRSGRAVDTQSSSSFGGDPSTRGAQSAEGAPRTASNSSHSIGPSLSSSRGTAANNPTANSSSNARPQHYHHHHRRRRHGGGGGGGSSGKQSARNLSATSSEKIAFPVEL